MVQSAVLVIFVQRLAINKTFGYISSPFEGRQSRLATLSATKSPLLGIYFLMSPLFYQFAGPANGQGAGSDVGESVQEFGIEESWGWVTGGPQLMAKAIQGDWGHL